MKVIWVFISHSVMENVCGKSWSRPVLVSGPLGIVSWTELTFLAMFVALLIWSFCSYLRGMFENIAQQASNSGVHV